jgi:hypothetical protein
MSRRGIRFACALVCACIASPACASAATWAPPPPDFFGLNVNRLFNDGLPSEVVDRQLGVVQHSGITVARSDAMWAYVQPQAPNPLIGDSWTETDRRMAALASHHIRWQPVLDYTPKWQQSISGDDKSAPKSNDAFAQFASVFAARYGPGGTFWSQHPELPYLPVRAYEVWNEENGTFWTPLPNAAGYADLLVRTADAIHARDPAATVMVGGLVDDGGSFLRSIFSLRPDLAGRVDAVAFHPYAATAAGVVQLMDGLEATLASLGQGSLPVYVTEVGWVTSGPAGNPMVMADEARAANMTELVRRIAAAREADHIAGFMPYTFWTPEANPADPDDWYGLWHADGSATLEGDAYVKSIAAALAPAPAATTGAPAPGAVTQASATVGGAVNPGGCDASWRVQYATDATFRASGGYDQQSPVAGAGAGSADVPVSTVLGGLQPLTAYHYRVVASNACSSQTAEGADVAFTTPPSNDLSLATVKQAVDGTLVISGRNGSAGRNAGRATTTQPASRRDRAAAKKRKGKRRTVAYGTGYASTVTAGSFRLKIKPSSKTRKLLRQGRKLTVSVAVTFSPAGGTPNTKAARVTVKLKRAKRKTKKR